MIKNNINSDVDRIFINIHFIQIKLNLILECNDRSPPDLKKKKQI